MTCRFGHTVVAVAALALLVAQPASGAVTATHDGTQLNVVLSDSGDVATFRVGDGGAIVINDSSGGTGTVTNTETINVTDTSSGATEVVIEHPNLFQPGAGEDVSTSREIEWVIRLGEEAGAPQVPGDTVRVVLDDLGNTVAMGQDLGGGLVNFNAEEPLPKDEDASVVADLIQVDGGAADDIISGRGQGPDPIAIALRIDGGGGEDSLAGGDANDRIDSSDGVDAENIACLGGIDVAVADRLDAVGRDCETIRREDGSSGPGPEQGEARIAFQNRRLVFSRGRVGVPLRCTIRGTGICRGRITLRGEVRGAMRNLGSERYRLREGKHRVRIDLNGAGKRYFFRGGTEGTVRVRVTLRGGDGLNEERAWVRRRVI